MDLMWPFVSIGEADPTKLGAKARNLHELARRGHPIPDAVVVMPQVLDEALESTSRTKQAIEVLLNGQFAGSPVVVRSSAEDEDQAQATAPGVYDSYMRLTSVDSVFEAIRLCRESVDSADSVAYRQIANRTRRPWMAVVVQVMIDSELSGVAYSQSPVHEFPVTLVEAIDGVGAGLVAGASTPERRTFPRTTGQATEPITTNDPYRLAAQASLRLEEELGSPQDCEWGFTDGQLWLFQSRPATILPWPTPNLLASPRSTSRDSIFQSVSGGLAIGRIYSNGLLKNPILHTEIVVVDSQPSAAQYVEILNTASGVLSRHGGVLSHSGAMARELQLPMLTVRDLAAFDAFVAEVGDQPVLLDGYVGSVRPLGTLSPAEFKAAVFLSMRALGRQSRGAVIDDKYETVILDPISQSRIEAYLEGRGISPQVKVQTLIPFDEKTRTYTGTSARIQRGAENTRVQFKRANLLPDRDFRFDQEVHVPVSTTADGVAFLSALGYQAFEPQERQIRTYSDPEFLVNIQVNNWPGAHSEYMGVDATNIDNAIRFLSAAGVSPERCRALDGRDLFEILGLGLRGLTF